jgi:hypothetical protein
VEWLPIRVLIWSDAHYFAQGIPLEQYYGGEDRPLLRRRGLISKFLPLDGDAAVQNVVLLLLLLHTAGRPSTFMPTSETSFHMT